jgi:hypothetical protein
MSAIQSAAIPGYTGTASAPVICGVSLAEFSAIHSDTNTTLINFSSPVIGGDSDGIIFLPVTIGGIVVPVLIGCMNNTSGSAFYCDSQTAINAAMTALGVAGTIGTVSLASFTNYATY